MRGSSLTTFLMFLPLIAIPLIAIFGVPEFTPVNASPPAETNTGQPISIDRPTTPNGPGRNSPIGDTGSGDIFSPPGRDGDSAPDFPAALINSEGDPFLSNRKNQDAKNRSSYRGLNGWELDREREKRTRSTHRIETPRDENDVNSIAGPSRSTGMHSVPSGAVAPEKFTWRSAVRRLNQMGVRDFLLQAGSRADEFHFSCIVNSPGNPRITHRFEAEDSDPLRAVQKVLKQIEKQR